MAEQRYLTVEQFLTCMRVALGHICSSSVATQCESAIRDALLNVGHYQPTEEQLRSPQQPQQQQQPQQPQQGNNNKSNQEGTKKVKKMAKATVRTVFWKIYFWVFKQRQYTGNSLMQVANAYKWFCSQPSMMEDLNKNFGQLIDIMNRNTIDKDNRDQQFWTWVEQNNLQPTFDKYVPDAKVIADFIHGLSPDNTQAGVSPDNTQAEQQPQVSDEEFHIQQASPHVQVAATAAVSSLQDQGQQPQLTLETKEDVLSDESEKRRKKRERKKQKNLILNGTMEDGVTEDLSEKKSKKKSKKKKKRSGDDDDEGDGLEKKKKQKGLELIQNQDENN